MADNNGYPVISGGTDSKGRVVQSETYDRGNYTETITKVTSDSGRVDIYQDKTAKK